MKKLTLIVLLMTAIFGQLLAQDSTEIGIKKLTSVSVRYNTSKIKYQTLVYDYYSDDYDTTYQTYETILKLDFTGKPKSTVITFMYPDGSPGYPFLLEIPNCSFEGLKFEDFPIETGILKIRAAASSSSCCKIELRVNGGWVESYIDNNSWYLVFDTNAEPFPVITITADDR